ncbi:MAG: hypothetical protein H6978_06960 [Gammaproteobacteria bacterium]|nr:hypothetical protein [Gammaproteobacteria bacterium]
MAKLVGREALFPSIVSSYELESAGAMQQALLTVVQESVIETVNKGMFQTPGNLHHDSRLADFIGQVKAAIAEHFYFMRYDYEGFEITNCWGNLYRHLHSLTRHCHPNNFISGVYYVKAPRGSGAISFFDPRPQASVIDPEKTQFTPYNSGVVSVPPVEGRLLLFPSWLEHQVEFTVGDEARVSISFNAMLTGCFGASERFRTSRSAPA